MATEEKNNSSERQEEYTNVIRMLRNGETVHNIEKYKEIIKDNTMNLDSLIERMEVINNTVSKLVEQDTFTVKDHLSFMIKKGHKFNDHRYDVLFSNTKQPGCSFSVRKGKGKKELFGGYYERLYGFIQKEGFLGWEKEKRDEFISYLRDNTN